MIIKAGDFIEFGERKWATWKVALITLVEKNAPHWRGLRTAYHYEVLVCNVDRCGWYPDLKGKFFSGAPLFKSPMKKVELNDIPGYIGAPKITKCFEKVLKGEMPS